VFLTERGKHFQPTRVERRAFKPAAETLGLEPFSWRSFRRAGATAIHNDGTPLKVQQDIMGHTTPEMSMLYTAAELTARRQAIARLEEIMFGVSDSFANGRELDASRVFCVQDRPN
jgi:integrase